MRLGIVAVVVVCVMSTGRADPADDARAHHDAAKHAYELGDYDTALREWTAAYQAVPARGTLVNLGQVHRKRDDLAKAREFYLRYLAEAPADEGTRCSIEHPCSAELVCGSSAVCADPLRPQVVELIAEIDRAEAAGALHGKPGVPPPAVAARAVTEPAVAPIERPAPAPRARRWWLWAVVGSALAVAVVASVVVASGGDPVACSAAELGCVDRR